MNIKINDTSSEVVKIRQKDFKIKSSFFSESGAKVSSNDNNNDDSAVDSISDEDEEQKNEEQENQESSQRVVFKNNNKIEDQKEEKLSQTKHYQNVPKEKRKISPIKNKIKIILNHTIVQTSMTIITLYILFADDFKMITTNSASDNIFSSICVAIMAMFSIEFLISCFVIEDYFLGFYFWLDLISILSMLLDIHWFYDFIILLFSGSSGDKTNIKGISTIAKAGRAAKVGSRAIRILRILRIIRLVRISKLYKASEKIIEDKINKKNEKLQSSKTQSFINNRANTNQRTNQDEKQNEDENIPQESKVGKKLSDFTTRRVIILILTMMMVIILFDSSFYISPMTSMDFGIKIFKEFSDLQDNNINNTFNIFVNEHLNSSSPIIYAKVGSLIYGDLNNTEYLRDSEQIISSEDCTNLFPNDELNSYCLAIFDNRPSSQLSSILNIIKTIFICGVLSGGAICFSKVTSEMVLEPIESMIQKIKEISKNPIEAMQRNEKEEFAKSLMEQEENGKNKTSCIKCLNRKEGKKKEAPLETIVLENTISKIGALLALGFGEAGSEIIAGNMQNNKNGEVNPLLPGKKVMAIYGFCDIRNFTDTTEVLKEKVMIFVNEIAEIVHEITAEHCGSANKNIGDAFLLVWKFEDQFVHVMDTENNLQLIQCQPVNQLCDLALISYIKILAKIQKSHKLDKYRKNEGLNKRIKNYSVKMGFGLHLGWSIEGAIGSAFKIDASYLSPNVNTANKLEEKTKEYGVQLVISENFIEFCSEDLKRRARIIDKYIGENGEEESLYTIDIDLTSLTIEDKDSDDEINIEDDIEEIHTKQFSDNLHNAITVKKLAKYKKRIIRKKNYDDAVNCYRNIWLDYEENDEDYLIMRKKFKPEFYEFYKNGFNHYINGDWKMAKFYFEKGLDILGDKDGPTENLIQIMRVSNFERPVEWNGYRRESTH